MFPRMERTKRGLTYTICPMFVMQHWVLFREKIMFQVLASKNSGAETTNIKKWTNSLKTANQVRSGMPSP